MDAGVPVVCASLIFIAIFLLALVAKTQRKKQWIPSLERKHVLVTGGSSGIGLAIAIEVLEQGGFVTLISNTSSQIEEALLILNSSPDRVFTKVADVGDYEGISRAIKESFQWRPFDIVICNAGIGQKLARLDEAKVTELDLIIRTNLTGAMYTVHAALPFMKKRSSKCQQSLVLMGSMASLHPVYGHSIYTATKHALKGMGECLRLELLPFNIRVNVCCPGFTRTPLLDHAGHHDPENDDFLRIMKVVDLYNPKRVKEPREIAKATVETIKEGTFLMVVGGNKLQGLFISAFCRGVFRGESIARTILEISIFFLCRVPTLLFMRLAMETVKRVHGKNAKGDLKSPRKIQRENTSI